jgi:hypothetical protein
MSGLMLRSKGMKSLGRYGGVGLELLLSMAVGYCIGHWLDQKFETGWIGGVGFLLGCYAGFRTLFRTARQMQRDIEREERLERGEDPWAEPSRDESERDLSDTTTSAAAKDGETEA